MKNYAKEEIQIFGDIDLFMYFFLSIEIDILEECFYLN